MKASEATKRFMAREPVILAAYLTMKPEVIRSSAPKAGKSAETFILKHQILWGRKTYEFAEFVDTEDQLKASKPKAAEFTPVVIEVDKLEETKYGCRGQGKIHLLEQG